SDSLLHAQRPGWRNWSRAGDRRRDHCGSGRADRGVLLPAGRGDVQHLDSYRSAGFMTGWRVLVVDDEAGLRHTLELILRDEGCEVMTAADGEDGLRIALAEEPDLILCDVRMPRLDGLGFIDR